MLVCPDRSSQGEAAEMCHSGSEKNAAFLGSSLIFDVGKYDSGLFSHGDT